MTLLSWSSATNHWKPPGSPDSSYRMHQDLRFRERLEDFLLRRGRLESPSRIRVDAWQATASVCLTGEPASFAGPRPRRPYDPGQGQWGAVELAARVNGFEVDGLAFSGGFSDPSVSARKAFAWGLGLNWHLTRNVKQSASFERTSFTGGAPGGSDRPAENALFIRTQVAF